MSTSTPVLDALEAEKSAERDKEAIQRNHPHYKDAALASKKDKPKTMAAAAAAFSPACEAKEGDKSNAPLRKRAAKRAATASGAAQKASGQPGPATQPKAANAFTAPTCSQVIAVFSQQRQVWARRQPSTQTTVHQVEPHRRRISSSRPPTDSGTSITPVPAPSLAPASSDGSGTRSRSVLGLASRQFEAGLSGPGVTKGGTRRRDRAAEQEEEKEWEPAKDGLSRSKRETEGRRKTMHWRGAGLLQLRSLCSYKPPARGHAGPTTPDAASRCYIWCHGVPRR